MDEAVAVDLTDSCRQPNGAAQGTSQFERLPFAPRQDPIQRIAAGVFEDEHHPTFATGDLQRPGCPRGIKVGCERVFVLDLPEAPRRRLFCGERHYQDREWIAGLPLPVKRELTPFRRVSSTAPERSVMEGLLVYRRTIREHRHLARRRSAGAHPSGR